ncbi:unnamed protein product [Paramecium sonneborni]|uniref:Protein kinase domain-containing protein n=1 Tax=Paramecium sonneborni TaxID=65129 RepID=A0A8S1M6G6_9CILI|nr:unnamed protein product [Paramecium sonneborni]
MSQASIKLIGNYICNQVEILGQGLMCTVYEAKNRETNKYVALKQISKIQRSDTLTREKLRQLYELEIEILNKCKIKNYKNVISLIDNFETQNHFNIVLDLCDSNLKEYLEKQPGKRLEEQEAVDIFIQIFEGEKSLHELHYCHRDIKLENILIKDNCIKIADVSLAKYLEDLYQATSSRVGTPAYVAPEVRSQKWYSPYKADIYSLGVVLYNILYGVEDQRVDIIRKMENSPIKVNKVLQELIKNMLIEDPQKRADWQQVSFSIYQYMINNQQANSDSILMITSYYQSTWQQILQFLKQIIEDYSKFQNNNENLILSPSALFIIKLIYNNLEEKLLQSVISRQKEEEELYNIELNLISFYLKEYLKEAQKWYFCEQAAGKTILCDSQALKEEFMYRERSKNFNQHFQFYIADCVIKLDQLKCQTNGLKFLKKLLQLKLLIAYDYFNDFQQVQELLSKSKLSSEKHIISFCQEINQIETVEQYLNALSPIIQHVQY